MEEYISERPKAPCEQPVVASGFRRAVWQLTRVVFVGAVIVGLLLLAVFLVCAGIAVAEGAGELFVRASIGAIVMVTLVWLFGRAARYAGHRTTDLAIARRSAAIHLDPQDAASHLQRAGAHVQRREYAEAIAHYDAVIRLDSDDRMVQSNAYAGRVNAYARLGQLDRVIAEYTEAIEIDPTDALVYCARATAYNALGRWDLSVADATEAIRLDPDLYLGYDARGYGYWQWSNFNWAIKLVANAWAVATFAFLRRNYFLWRLKTGTRAEVEQAVADFTEALRLNPVAFDCYSGRAMAYRSLGEHARAAADETAVRAATIG